MKSVAPKVLVRRSRRAGVARAWKPLLLETFFFKACWRGFLAFLILAVQSDLNACFGQQAGKSPEPAATKQAEESAPQESQESTGENHAEELGDNSQISVWQDLGGWNWDGYLDLHYRYRHQGRQDVSDSDLLASGTIQGGYRDAAGVEEFGFLFDGLLTADLDGFGSRRDAFYGLQETRNSRVHGFLYQGWVETGQLLDHSKVRLGRQEITRQDALYFDGFQVGYQPVSDWKVNFFGGIPAHFEESSREGDYLGGAGAQWAVSRTFSVGFDEVYLRDRQRIFGTRKTFQTQDNLTLVSGRWLASQEFLVRGTASFIENKNRRQEFSLAWNRPRDGWQASLAVRRQNDYGELVSTEFSPFQTILGDVAPYWNVTGQVSKTVAEDVQVGGGYSFRRLETKADEGANNREFDRWFTNVDVDHFPLKATDVGFRADFWDSVGGRIKSYSFFAGLDWAAHSRLEAGTDFTLYRFDVFSAREFVDDRQIYVRAKVNLAKNVDLDLRWVRDASQFGVDHLIDLTLGLEF